MNTIFTIGHSNHPLEFFIELLRRHGVTALADVRSSPYSRYTSQFNQESLKRSLKEVGIQYVFLGRELGARSTNPNHYRDGKAQYELMAQEPWFQEGLDRLRKGVATQRIALMCAEKDPIECHRTMLVGVRVRSSEIALAHILANGELETHEQSEQRMLVRHHLADPELFRTAEERLAEAYRLQCDLIQYEDKKLISEQQGISA
jgi:uncharacterized protein (DUF488 family)